MNAIVLAVLLSYGVPRMVTMRSNELPQHWIVSLREIGWRKANMELFTDPVMDLVAPNFGAQMNLGSFFVAGRAWIFKGGWTIRLLRPDIEHAEFRDASGFNLILGYTYSLIRFNYQFLMAGHDLHNSLMVGASPISFLEAEIGYDLNAAAVRGGLALKFRKDAMFLKLGVAVPGPGIAVVPVIDFGASW